MLQCALLALATVSIYKSHCHYSYTIDSSSRWLSCLHLTAPPYLADEFHQSSDVESRQRLRSASSSSLVVRRTRLSIIGDRAFPVAASRLWNTLPPQNVPLATSLSVFRNRLTTISSIVPSLLHCSALAVTSHTIIDLFTYLLITTITQIALISWNF